MVRQIYRPFTTEEISDKIAPAYHAKRSKTSRAGDLPNHRRPRMSVAQTNLGDWYFTGNYPTAGGKPRG